MNNLTTSTCKRYTRNPEMNLREAKCYKQAEKKDNDTITMKFLLHKDNEEKRKMPPLKSKSVAALPCNRPFAATHMLFLPTRPLIINC